MSRTKKVVKAWALYFDDVGDLTMSNSRLYEIFRFKSDAEKIVLRHEYLILVPVTITYSLTSKKK